MPFYHYEMHPTLHVMVWRLYLGAALLGTFVTKDEAEAHWSSIRPRHRRWHDGD
jgi:hypothetical protein